MIPALASLIPTIVEKGMGLFDKKFETDSEKLQKRAEYDVLFPEYREMTYEEYLSTYTDSIEDIYLLTSIEYSELEKTTAEWSYVVYFDYSENENHVTFEEWLNETRVVSEAIEATYDEDGNELTTYIAEVTELVRPYVASDVTELVEAYLVPYYTTKAKEDVAEQLATLTVTTSNGNEFDANDQARLNMSNAILVADVVGMTETTWRLADNSEVLVTLAELKEALALAIQEFARVKSIGA